MVEGAVIISIEFFVAVVIQAAEYLRLPMSYICGMQQLKIVEAQNVVFGIHTQHLTEHNDSTRCEKYCVTSHA